MDAYIALLERWGQRINLVSKGEKARLWHHVEDSRTLIPHLPQGLDRLIDLGSGQGFPAIPIAIETGIVIELIEADRRKAAFLETALATLQLCGSVSPVRLEAAIMPPARCVTARALAPLAGLVIAARRFLTEDGCCLFLKGRKAEGELEAVRAKYDVVAELIPAPNMVSCLVKISRIR